eukprot:TRINITY_DN2076_c0_g1_i2.p1 TRINITY_DN2076_c0_g1~~TRINITY_DN2076_c0_g1_i2.p1  ORF type:complete len:524 (-),score=144.87 TRINITY_DN2076_c0_g1_i2:276-1847(-)
MSGVEDLIEASESPEVDILPEKEGAEYEDDKDEEAIVEEDSETGPESEDESDSGDSWIVVEEDSSKISEAHEESLERDICGDILRALSSSTTQSLNPEDETMPKSSHSSIEDLPPQYPKIEKGYNYAHRPNRDLNVFLTASIVLGLALAFGFGYGHFLGWSERLEAHRTESSLDETILIEQLKSENEELRTSINEAKVLRNQIKDLMLENSNLEKEIEELRLNQDILTDSLASQKSIDELRYMLDQTNSLLKETRANLNEITSENEVLKIEVGKARYGRPSLPPEEEDKINELISENEKLKKEVENIHYTDQSDGTSSKEFSCFNYIKDFIKESTGKTQRIVRNAKKRFDSEWKPKLNVVGEKFSEEWRDLKDYTLKSSLKEKMETTRDTVSKVGESIVSFVEDLKVFGQEWFMDDDFSWPMAAKKEDKKDSPEVHPVKEDNSWYIQRGKDREFIRNTEGGAFQGDDNQKNWLFQRASSRKKSRNDEDPSTETEDEGKKYSKQKKYSNSKQNWKRQNKRYRGD